VGVADFGRISTTYLLPSTHPIAAARIVSRIAAASQKIILAEVEWVEGS